MADNGIRCAVTGYEGRLGSKLIEAGYLPLPCDITSPSNVKSALLDVRPDVIINCAAYTSVDDAEENQVKAYIVNRTGVAILRAAFDGWIIHMSTDYVFGGFHGPYTEGFQRHDDLPRGAYGKSKASGEDHIIKSKKPGTIIRTTILYGNPGFPDFVTHVLDRLAAGMPFEVSTNLIGSPTYVPHLVEGIRYLVDNLRDDPPQIINIAGSDVISRYDFALMIASIWGYDKQLITPMFKGKHQDYRPKRAGLRTTKAKKIGIPIYSVIQGLEAMKNDSSSM